MQCLDTLSETPPVFMTTLTCSGTQSNGPSLFTDTALFILEHGHVHPDMASKARSLRKVREHGHGDRNGNKDTGTERKPRELASKARSLCCLSGHLSGHLWDTVRSTVWLRDPIVSKRSLVDTLGTSRVVPGMRYSDQERQGGSWCTRVMGGGVRVMG